MGKNPESVKKMIRPATKENIKRILEIYASAKLFMRESGNPNQWNGAYPDPDTLYRDIEKGNLYVMVSDETCRLYGVFALIGGEDATYGYIEGGQWRSNSPYGTLHRVAGDGTEHGIFRKAAEFALEKFDHVRVDTHHDNKTMQKAILNFGFSYRGVIYLTNGDPRLAYDYLRE